MIATWQYVALRSIVTAVLAILQNKTSRTERGDTVFLARLEGVLTATLATERFVLTRETHALSR